MFEYRLAARLGRTRDELLATTSYREIQHWKALYRIEPWGEETMWLRFAALMAFIVNMFRGKSETMAKPKDFMPVYKRDK